MSNKCTWTQARQGAATGLITLVSVIYVAEIFVVVPTFFQRGCTAFNLSCLFMTYEIINLLYNMLCMLFTDPSISSLMLVQQAKNDWSYCLKCESVRPPRAHHCRRCDICVLRFDHHCTYMAQCVGHANMPYFIRLLLHVAFCCIFFTFFNMPFAMRFVYSDWQWWQFILCTFNPLPFMLIRWLSFHQFLVCLMTSFCAILGPTFALFFAYHMRQVLRNETSVEVMISNSRNPTQICYEDELRSVNYNVGWRGNLEQVLGRRWLVGFFIPFVPVSQTSDGLHFPSVPINARTKTRDI
ncbi:unnamed protein product [Mesocestoides corti]|uniref:Palmitoyltransferase n=2 Tax=Mesocestoides corti TaxID=53468 RepID=A0A0R3U9B6_MESCO|nr:unnamed protein product [Mesocestoides corti]